ncbi:IS30 family transposase, partial [Gilliamella sp. wkB108]|uniref:IS30 family transposase n=1 Tax=Gilliamella sp. wkB108 TaxID=3120256 RepID=UPI000AAFC23A
IIGGNRKQALVTIVERKTGLALIKKVERKTAEEVKKAIISLLTNIKHRVKTITSDNGLEFAEHKAIAKALDCQYYFAHPYSSWERGSNENLNGLIRQYFPKRMVFDSISDEEIKAVENRLNHRPRKRLKYKIPYQAFY